MATRAIRIRKSFPRSPHLDDSVWSLVRDKATGVSKGGMASKLEAARLATTAGENVIIASGKQPGNLRRILAGEDRRHAVRRPRANRRLVETLDRLHRPAARHPGGRRWRPHGDRSSKAKVCCAIGIVGCRRHVSQRRRGCDPRRSRRRIRPRTVELFRRRRAAHQRTENRTNRRRSRPMPLRRSHPPRQHGGDHGNMQGRRDDDAGKGRRQKNEGKGRMQKAESRRQNYAHPPQATNRLSLS